ncbi:HEAT repeat domain-containing protein [Streptomyces sp. APSN-46.1]|uniref:HEAT repeat domain-containing protein n=1 Tax=Streptomyces sp. APSN-46.1 TaxID=2929049 RepID=UPI001FB4E22C|nr:HEAT repeat domain-containing protein [Streptomyces sp. APSN-46.1]MCJ1679565.1 HEAT repeat domain-containing protein [Streptomyces sp. APSN-46.1]
MGAGQRRAADQGRAVAELLLSGEADGVGEVLPGAGPEAWTAFDEEVRSIHRRWYGFPRSNRAEVRLCHPDGRVREGALRAPHPPPELLVIRCADWVPAVREQARRRLTEALAADPVPVLHRLTPLVLRLGRRGQGAWALERFGAELRGSGSGSGGGSGVLAGLLDSADLPTRRFAARLAVEAGEYDVRELARRAAEEPDPVTAGQWADSALAAMAADGPDDEAVDRLRGARIPMVRAAGVTALRRAGRASEAARHLTDRSGLVRACARWLVRQDGGDPYARYRELVADPARVSPYAVTGFSECAERADAPLLRALLEHRADAVRAAALGGLRALDGTVDQDRLRALLDDPSPAVAREASLSLCDSAERLPADWLLARITPERPPHTRRAAYRLLHTRGGVAGLRASVELLTDRDPGLRHIAAQRIRSLWSPYRPPGLPFRDLEVGALLDRCTHLFSDYVMNRMRSQLGLPRPRSTTDGY